MARIHFYWDVHTNKVSRRAKAWASSDRGWLFTRGEIPGFAEFRDRALGHYLDYSGCSGYEGREDTVHAVSCVSRNCAWFYTPDEAMAWIMGQASLDIDRVKDGRVIQRRAHTAERARVIAALGLAPEDPADPYVGTTAQFQEDLANRATVRVLSQREDESVDDFLDRAMRGA